jgi:transcriptional regulator with GAF, ATPase, and Fis domain
VDRPGLIESADGGSLFLDEIGELSKQGQASLLRVIEEGTLRRLGSNHSRHVDVRLIAATNRDLQTAVRNGLFRADLYYRINQLGVTIPPLRKRRQDIPEIARKYLVSLRPDVNWRIESGTLAILARYGWPGNVRELQSVLLKATLSARNGIVLPRDIRLN